MLSQRRWIWQVFLYKLLKHYNSLTPVKHGTFLSGGIAISLLRLGLAKPTGLAAIGRDTHHLRTGICVFTNVMVSVQRLDDSDIAISNGIKLSSYTAGLCLSGTADVGTSVDRHYNRDPASNRAWLAILF